ncbi:MAG: hypothetical protein WCO89_12000 [Syntrophus sp. (in: bacteria)]
MRNIRENCFKVYCEENGPATPMEELGRIFLGADHDARNICSECRKGLGILSPLGAGE